MKGTKGQFEYNVHTPDGKQFVVVTPEHTDALSSRSELFNKYPGCGFTTKVITLSCCKEIVGTKPVPKGMVIG